MFPSGRTIPTPHRLMAYIADLELEVDRLRKQGQYVRRQVQDTLRQILSLSQAPADASAPTSAMGGIATVAGELASTLRDLHELPGYHPSHDQVVAIAVRPLVEQVFRWQQRLIGMPDVTLHLELEADHVEWFPARLRHILDNLLSNALKFRDRDKTESWVRLGLRATPQGYEFRVADNGLGLTSDDRDQVFELFYRSSLARTAGLGVGLAVVKMLVEQSGGSLTLDAGEGQGTTITMVLPPYDMDDFIV